MATAYLIITLALLLLSRFVDKYYFNSFHFELMIIIIIINCYALGNIVRMAADDWDPAHPGELDDDEPEELENIWNMHNCIWLTVGSIMQQGCDILPKYVLWLNFCILQKNQ